MKSVGKARNNGLYRHIRTSKEIIRNLLNDYIKRMPALQADGYLFAWHLVLPSRTLLLQQAHGFLHFYGLVFFC